MKCPECGLGLFECDVVKTEIDIQDNGNEKDYHRCPKCFWITED